MGQGIRKIGWYISLVAMIGALGIIQSCRRWAHPDQANMARSDVPDVEVDPLYMKCNDFMFPKTSEPVPSGASNNDQVDTEKIVILYSSSGTGHKSAADAVQRALHASEEKILGVGRKFVIAEVDILSGLLPKKDLFDEYLKAEEWRKLKDLVAMQGVAEKLVYTRQLIWDNKILNRIMRACDDRPPSMVISVFPVANYVYADIIKKNNIPMIIVPTDFKIDHFLNKIDTSQGDRAKIFLSLALDEPEMKASLYSKNSEKPIVPYCITGYPLREEFITLRSTIDDATKANPLLQAPEILNYRTSVLKIPERAKSIMITLGGKGGALELILQYLDKLYAMQKNAPLPQPLHVVVASGGDEELMKGLRSRVLAFGNDALFKTEILGRLDAANMAMTMASVDAVLLKPGGSTVAEAIMLGTPMLIKSDSTEALPWERANMFLVTRLGWGVDLAPAPQLRVDGDDLVTKVKQILAGPFRRNKTPFINFQTEFPKVVNAIRSQDFSEVQCFWGKE